jgi:hemoglobin
MKFLKDLFSKTPKSFYDQIGQETGIKELVQNFYEVMLTDPKAKECLLVHKLDEGSIPFEVKDKLFMFLSGWLGGPNLFVENHGHPRMRMRHMHVKIGQTEAEQWLYCMQSALDKHSIKMSKKFKNQFLNSCKGLAIRIINA